MNWPTTTGRRITIDFNDGRERIVKTTPIHAVGAAIDAAIGSDFYGSCQITVEPCQLEPFGSVSGKHDAASAAPPSR